ncbi:glycosyltransferase family 4 protein [Thalassovita mediterranea]|nr:glycosyltransferase family 4 protein [Thalassovita mediterranea]
MSRAITFFATGITLSDGGIASANRNVLAALERMAARHECVLNVRILHEPSEICRRVADSGARVFKRAYSGKKHAMAPSIVSALASSRLVVFDHVHLATPLAMLSHLTRLRNTRTAICAHGSESWKRLKPISEKAFRAADLILANSDYTLRHMRETIDGFNGINCPLGLPPHFALTPAPPARNTETLTLRAADGTERKIGKRAMLLVARMDAGEQEKGHRELIAAMPDILERVQAAELIFVGGGSDSAAIAEIAAASSAAAHIYLTGHISSAELAKLYSAAYAYTMPSRQEGFGLVYLEAMNYALPCLACHDDGAADVVADGKTGVLISQPIDQQELTDAAVALLSNPARAKSLGEAGWRRLNDQFTAAAHQARLQAALDPLFA